LKSRVARLECPSVSRPNRISFIFILAVLIATGWLHLGPMLLSVLFSYYAISKLDFLKPRGKWPAIAIFLTGLAVAAYGLAFFVQATAEALPGIAEKSVPAIIQWAAEHQIVLPFTDFQTLKDQALDMARDEAKNIGKFADFARGATTQFVYLSMGCLVAMGLFLNPEIEMDHPKGPARNNLYTLCCEEIGRRFATFYKSFAIVMNAQITVSVINAVLTGIFMAALGLPHLLVAVGITFICGLLPVVGNILSNIVVVAIGFMVSPGKGLGALVFLVCIHHLGFFLNSKIIGAKIRSPIWLTLIALVVGERLMGVTGMILSPVALHYIRIEASKIPVDPDPK
jgi:predicted PurR-regulated permease PerM